MGECVIGDETEKDTKNRKNSKNKMEKQKIQQTPSIGNSQTDANPTFEEDKTRHADLRQDPDGQDHHPRG